MGIIRGTKKGRDGIRSGNLWLMSGKQLILPAVSQSVHDRISVSPPQKVTLLVFRVRCETVINLKNASALWNWKFYVLKK